MKNLRFQLATLCGVLLLTASGAANAGLVRASWVGVVQSATDANAFGVEVGDFVFGNAIFDTDWLLQPFLPDDEVYLIVHEANPLFQLSASIGTRTFVESEDGDWPDAPFFPTLGFLDASSLAALEGSWDGIAFDTCQSAFFPDCDSADGLGFGSPSQLEWLAYEDGVAVAGGKWLPGTIKIQPIPVPAALPLMFGALMALFGFARRR